MKRSNNDDQLAIIRLHSKKWHKTIDTFGISKALKNNTLDEHQYHAWLMHNLSFINYLDDQANLYQDEYKQYKAFLPDNDASARLKDDLPSSLHNKLTSLESYLDSDTKIPAIIPVYIYQGSVMGKRMVKGYIEQSLINVKTAYLDTTTQANSFMDFMNVANGDNNELEFSELDAAIANMWNALIENYRSYLS